MDAASRRGPGAARRRRADQGAAPLRPAHGAVAARQAGVGARRSPSCEPDLIVDTGDNLGHERGIEGIRRAFERVRAASPACSSTARTTTSVPPLKNPFTYFGGPSGVIARAKRLDIDELHALLRRARLARPRQHGGEPRPARHALRVLRRRRPAPGLRPPRPHHRGDRRAARRRPARRRDVARRGIRSPSRRPTVTVGVTHAPYQRVLNSFVNHGAQLMLAGHTHGGQVCVPGLRRARHELRHPARAGRRASASGSTGCARRSSTSRPASARRSTRRCASPARPRPRC